MRGTSTVWTRAFWTLIVAVATTGASRAQITSPIETSFKAAPSHRVLLIPLDDRPATTQFAQMMGSIAELSVETPPAQLLGRFTTPGNSEAILDWLEKVPVHQFDSVVVNVEMVCYGGLISSRTNATPQDEAIRRLRRLWKVRKANPGVRFYGFGAIQRIAPTALLETRSWRDALTQLVMLKSRIVGKPNQEQVKRAKALRAKVPQGEVEAYYEARSRNHAIQKELLRMTSAKAFDYLVLGQDDAQREGPHVAENKRLGEMAKNLKIANKVFFCEGIDQHSNVLLSRSILSRQNWTPAVHVEFADEIGKGKIAPYESTHVEESLLDQVRASGARIEEDPANADYTLYVNTPEPRADHFQAFVEKLTSDIDQGFPVAVADINLGTNGTGDVRLFDSLQESGRSMKLLSYAGWNTAGNTLGTAIPAANIYLAARRASSNDFDRELAQRAFLLHRLVNDFTYHRYTRPQAYDLQRRLGAEKEESSGTLFDAVNDFVRNDVSLRLEDTFRTQFKGRTFFAGPRQYRFSEMKDVRVELPWPRAYEVRIGFTLTASEVPL
jgi:hypothetical protein